MEKNAPKRGRGRPKTVDRRQAVAAAMDSYWREGVDAMSLNEVCRRAGLSKPALYREFDSEDGLLDAVIEHYREQRVVPLLSLLASDKPLDETLALLLAGLTADPGQAPSGCLFTQVRLTRPKLGPRTRGRMQAIERERLEAFEVWYRRALERGAANPALSPALAARYLDAQISILLLQMGAGEPARDVRALGEVALGLLKRT